MCRPSGDGLVVRRVVHDDIPSLLPMLTGAAPHIGAPQTKALVKEAVDDRMALVATNDGEVVGCIMARHKPQTIIHALCVVPERRRRGLARTLIAAAVADVEFQTDCEAFWAAVDLSGPNAQTSFQDNGFELLNAGSISRWGHESLRLMRLGVESKAFHRTDEYKSGLP